MIVTQKRVGLGIAAVAVALMASGAIADNMNRMNGHGMGTGGPMMAPSFSFDTIDANQDGKISPEEVSAWRSGQTAGVDANGDDKLSVEELAAMRLKEMQAAAQDMAQKMVDARDTDGDKMLSAAELLAPPMPGDLFGKLDTNKDGFIDKAEAAAARAAMRDHLRGSHAERGGRGAHLRPPMAPDMTVPGGGSDGDGGN